MKILITGAAGFIGSHTAERFADMGYTVTGIDNFNSYYDTELKHKNAQALKNKGVGVLNLDLKDSSIYEDLSLDFDYIFHFAAQPGISTTSSFEDYFSNNFIVTKNLVDYALKCSHLKLLVNISTSSVYGLEATKSEETAPKPASYYGVTKLAAEQLVLQKSREQQLKTCSLRLYSVIGPRERPEKMYAKLIKCGIEGTSFQLFEGSEKHLRSFTYVGDIVDGIVSVVDKDLLVDGEIINLGTEKEYTTKQGIEAVEKVLGHSIVLEVVPKRPGDQFRTKANIDKAKRLLNYNPKTSLIESVKYQVEWYKINFL